jgi:hypothetical protein
MKSASGIAFVHVMLYKCPECGAPIATALVKEHRNVEPIDGKVIQIQCLCGWSGQLLGVTAMRHWVEAWTDGRLKDEYKQSSIESDGLSR